MKDKLSNFMEQPGTLQGYIELCYKADGLLRRRENDKKSRNTPKAPARTTASTTYVPDQRITEPMDLSSGRKKLTSEERQKRISEGRCMYCGGLGHVVRNCTVKPLKGNGASLSPATPVPDPSPTPSSSSGSLSGNGGSHAP